MVSKRSKCNSNSRSKRCKFVDVGNFTFHVQNRSLHTIFPSLVRESTRRTSLSLRLDRPDVLDPLNRVAGFHHMVRRLADQVRVPPKMVVREPKVERLDGFEGLNVLIGQGDLEGFDIVLEVLDLATANCEAREGSQWPTKIDTDSDAVLTDREDVWHLLESPSERHGGDAGPQLVPDLEQRLAHLDVLL
jgi:hypothetical protein